MASTEYNDLSSLASQLVTLETENPPGNERACAEFIHEWFINHGINADLVLTPIPERPQVVARVGQDDPTLVLNGHTDVVPADDPDNWTHDPYAGVIENGTLYGRGSVDMKTGIALSMLTARDLAPEIQRGNLAGSLVVHAAMGEETADPGTKTLLECGYDGDYAVVLEPTDFRVATRTKGLACYELIVKGVASHASHPDQGRNAITEAQTVVDAVGTYDKHIREREDSLCGRGYATITEFEAGVDSNLGVIPNRARFVLDRRILPGETIETVDTEIEKILQDVMTTCGITTEWTRIQHYASSTIPDDDPLAVLFRDLSTDFADTPTDPWCIEAATDMRNFVNDAGIPAITWGPGPLEAAHTIDESIDLENALTGIDILTRAARDLLDN